MFSGEMVEEAKTKEGYKPEWDDAFVDDENPIETKHGGRSLTRTCPFRINGSCNNSRCESYG